MKIDPALLALLLPVFVAVRAEGQVVGQVGGRAASACAPTDSAAVAEVRQRLETWVQDANKGDRARMSTIWGKGLTGWFPQAALFSDTASFRLAAGPDGGQPKRPAITYEIRIDDIRAGGPIVIVHDVWREKRSYEGISRSTERVIRSSELWACEADGEWRIVRYVSAPEPWELVTAKK